MAPSSQFSKRIPEGGLFETHWRLHQKRRNSALYLMASCFEALFLATEALFLALKVEPKDTPKSVRIAFAYPPSAGFST